MPLIPMHPLLDFDAKHKFGVWALNVNNLEQIQAIMKQHARRAVLSLKRLHLKT